MPFKRVAPLVLEVNIQLAAAYRDRLDPAWVEQVARAVLETEGTSGPIEVGILICGAKRVRALNRRYLGHDYDTDVIAFALTEGEGRSPPDGVIHLGEAIISYPQARKQAARYGHSLQRELALLIAHGVLHLLGYDDQDPQREPRMRAREAAVLERLGELAR
ncbi:MAG: rRNA maturation RNase YbeY [Dehalococcoidia bacterium]|nr:rRNA maturation RNase YbeY [Dehalococcoidia bacterium]